MVLRKIALIVLLASFALIPPQHVARLVQLDDDAQRVILQAWLVVSRQIKAVAFLDHIADPRHMRQFHLP